MHDTYCILHIHVNTCMHGWWVGRMYRTPYYYLSTDFRMIYSNKLPWSVTNCQHGQSNIQVISLRRAIVCSLTTRALTVTNLHHKSSLLWIHYIDNERYRVVRCSHYNWSPFNSLHSTVVVIATCNGKWQHHSLKRYYMTIACMYLWHCLSVCRLSIA